MSNQMGGQPAGRNNTLLIVVVVIVLLCLCCGGAAAAWALWTYGDVWFGATGTLLRQLATAV
jgi:hypothetical protein